VFDLVGSSGHGGIGRRKGLKIHTIAALMKNTYDKSANSAIDGAFYL